jgi:hypothetical protein
METIEVIKGRAKQRPSVIDTKKKGTTERAPPLKRAHWHQARRRHHTSHLGFLVLVFSTQNEKKKKDREILSDNENAQINALTFSADLTWIACFAEVVCTRYYNTILLSFRLQSINRGH